MHIKVKLARTIFNETLQLEPTSLRPEPWRKESAKMAVESKKSITWEEHGRMDREGERDGEGCQGRQYLTCLTCLCCRYLSGVMLLQLVLHMEVQWLLTCLCFTSLSGALLLHELICSAMRCVAFLLYLLLYVCGWQVAHTPEAIWLKLLSPRFQQPGQVCHGCET